MSHLLPHLRLVGGQTVIGGVVEDRPLSIAEGRIVMDGGTEVDLSGFMVLPGIIDLHGDGFEHHLRPRPTTGFPLAAGLASYDREAVTHGITTAWMAQGWSWEGGPRGPEAAEALLEALVSYRTRALTDLRVQFRAETHFTEAADRLLDLCAQYGVDYVIFNDHLEEGLHMARNQPDAFAMWARKIGLTHNALQERLMQAQARAPQVPRSLRDLAQGFTQLGIRFGSHDDPDAETRDLYSMLGARIAEFPLNHRAAAAARALDNPILMGAPNVVRGGSQSGNVAATDLIRAGLCDALVSDYHLPALPLAAWTLADAGVLPFARAWEMISSAPARIMGLADRGWLAPGLRADIVIMDPETRSIGATINAGRLVHAEGRVALRLMGLSARSDRLAAE
jgi:alpha-D-ribose 1-methylphosphonate 5-triphosphate diphosphatase